MIKKLIVFFCLTTSVLLFQNCSPLGLVSHTLFQSFSSEARTNHTDFRVKPQRFAYFGQAKSFGNMKWHPTYPLESQKINVSFHGNVYNTCKIKQNCLGKTCFVRNSWVAPSRRVWDYTRIGAAQTYSPYCPGTRGHQISNSFVSLSSSHNKNLAGIGLYTHTGKRPLNATLSFLQPHQHQKILGTYVSFPAHLRGQMKPFSATCRKCNKQNAEHKIRMRVWSKQSVSKVKNNPHSQTQQKMAVVLMNKQARPTKQTPGRIEITPYTHCGGVHCNIKSPKLHYNVGDPYQGGMPFIGGPLLGGARASFLETRYGRTPLWRSYNVGTFGGTFGIQWFSYEISWFDFKQTLRHITKLRLGGRGTNKDVEDVFGRGWDQRHNWVLKYVRVAQEVYNPKWQSGAQSYVGGKIPWVQIDALAN